MEAATTPKGTKTRQLPIATISVLSITAIVTGAQLVYPPLLGLLERDPLALAAGQWWRLITPLLVHSDGWAQILVNLTCIALIGPTVERWFGPWRWLLLYLLAGFAAEVISYAWQPYGAGSSIALCGLIGGLCIGLIRRQQLGWPIATLAALCLIAALIGGDLGGSVGVAMSAVVTGSLLSLLLQRSAANRALLRSVGLAGLLGALTLTLLRDQHGPPILVGSALALLL